MSRLLMLLIVLVVTLGSGALAGTLSNRWGPRTGLVAAGAALSGVPTEFGDWRLEEETPLIPEVLAVLRASGHVSRRYGNRHTGEPAELFVVAGPPGEIAVHAPEVCYTGQGFRATGQRERISLALADGKAEFWRTPFVAESRGGQKLTVYYGWSDGKSWTAANWPRFAFATSPFLYKIQLAVPVVPGPGGVERDLGREFLGEFLPALQQAGIPQRSE